jgi:hypothetical protein
MSSGAGLASRRTPKHAVAAILLSAGVAPAQSVILAQDFESALSPAISPGVAAITPEQGYAGLGHSGDLFAGSFLRSPTGNLITVSLSGLPAHTSISALFLFAAIDSLDGTGNFPEGDFLKVTLDGVTIFRESFANALPSQTQSYNPPTGVQLARHVDLGFSGPGSYYTDSAYDLSLDQAFQHLAHSASTATLTFQIEGPGIQPLDDESWAMDNLRIALDCNGPTINGQPVPPITCQGGAATFAASASGTGLSYRWCRELGASGSNTWVDLANGAIPGSAAVASGTGTATMTLTNADGNAAVRYCCIVTNSCGGTATGPVALTVRPGGYANCDGSTTAPVVNTGDFTCFLQQYSAASALPSAGQQTHYANCDGSTVFPQVNTGDFTCFLQKYASGCP